MQKKKGEDWDRDEGATMLKRTISMKIAQSQLSALEAKYSGASETALQEKTFLELIEKTHSQTDDDALSKFRTPSYFISIYRESLSPGTPVKTIGELTRVLCVA